MSAASDDRPGIGDAVFDFELNLALLPLGTAAIYALCRVVLWSATGFLRRLHS